MKVTGINRTNNSNSTREKEEEVEGTSQDNNVDDKIPKRSRSKRMV